MSAFFWKALSPGQLWNDTFPVGADLRSAVSRIVNSFSPSFPLSFFLSLCVCVRERERVNHLSFAFDWLLLWLSHYWRHPSRNHTRLVLLLLLFLLLGRPCALLLRCRRSRPSFFFFFWWAEWNKTKHTIPSPLFFFFFLLPFVLRRVTTACVWYIDDASFSWQNVERKRRRSASFCLVFFFKFFFSAKWRWGWHSGATPQVERNKINNSNSTTNSDGLHTFKAAAAAASDSLFFLNVVGWNLHLLLLLLPHRRYFLIQVLCFDRRLLGNPLLPLLLLEGAVAVKGAEEEEEENSACHCESRCLFSLSFSADGSTMDANGNSSSRRNSRSTTQFYFSSLLGQQVFISQKKKEKMKAIFEWIFQRNWLTDS